MNQFCISLDQVIDVVMFFLCIGALLSLASFISYITQSPEERKFAQKRRRALRVMNIAKRFDKWLQFESEEDREFYERHKDEAITWLKDMQAYLYKPRRD